MADGIPSEYNGRALPVPGIDVTAAPSWWLTRPQEIREFLESLDGVTVEVIGRTAGGRDIIAAAWGEREMLEGRTCDTLAAAFAGGDTSRFYGTGQRERQVVMLVGATHGNEFQGTVAALSYLNILVTGKDLLGREQPAMAAEGRRHRFIVIPLLNVDGRERIAEHVNWINVDPDYYNLATQGLWRDGRVVYNPATNLVQPMTADDFAWIGSYCNDAGVNLEYNMGLGPDMQPENAALLRYCRREMPDCVILAHSNNGTLVESLGTFLPPHYRQRLAQMAALVGMRCRKAGFPKHNIAQPRWDRFEPLRYHHVDAIYHACGALGFVMEFPCGWLNTPDSCEGILDLSLAALDEVFVFGGRYRFRPNDPPAG